MNGQSPAKMIKKLLIDEEKAVKWLADELGITYQSLRNKLYRDSFTFQDVAKILDILGYEIELQKKQEKALHGGNE